MLKKRQMEFFKTTTTTALLILCVLLMSCTAEQITEEQPTPQPVPAEQVTIEEPTLIHNPAEVFIRESLVFEPTAVTISPGQSVTWQTQQSIPEPIRLQSSLFVSETLQGNDLFTFVFEEPGTYDVEIVNQGQTMSVLVE